MAFPVPNKEITAGFLQRHKDLIMVETEAGDSIPCLHIKKKHASHTVIYSHGNGEDLGYIIKANA